MDFTVAGAFQRPWDVDPDADEVTFFMERDSDRGVEDFQTRLPRFVVDLLTDAQLDLYLQYGADWRARTTEFGATKFPEDTTLDTRLKSFVGRTFRGVSS